MPAPASTPPLRPTNRRKTLAGFDIVSTVRTSDRLKAKRRAAPIAKQAEALLCRQLGVSNDVNQVTEEAVRDFISMFQKELPSVAIAALRALFRLDCNLVAAVEDALVAHGGAAAAEHEPSAEDVAI